MPLFAFKEFQSQNSRSTNANFDQLRHIPNMWLNTGITGQQRSNTNIEQLMGTTDFTATDSVTSSQDALLNLLLLFHLHNTTLTY